MRKMAIKALLFLIIILTGFIFFAHHQIIKTAEKMPPEGIEYVMILGAKVNGSELSLALKYRADAAIRYLRENPDAFVVTTGGQGEGEDIPEAVALKNYLMKMGIDERRILTEDASTSTYENLKFAKELYDIEEAVIVSNDFHLFRAVKNARSLGIQAFPLAAKTPEIVKKKLYVREYLAILRLYVFGK